MLHTSNSSSPASNAAMEQALRHAVHSVYKSGDLENLTIKRIRKFAEKELHLQDDFFKTDASWKDKSKSVIQSEVDAHTEPEAASSQPVPEKTRVASPKPQEQHRKRRGTKCASAEKPGYKKRRKKDTSETEISGSEEEPPKRKLTAKTKAKSRSSSRSTWPPVEEANGIDGASTIQNEPTKSESAEIERSESDMSELIDEAPKPKQNRKSLPTDPRTKKAKNLERKKATEGPPDQDAEEIKKLQGWLVKCGIRKMWFRELAPYDNPKAKIKHLKGMLVDAGMTGRYSEAKAQQIREQRELKADIEAVQEGDRMWGQATADEDLITGRPKRRLAKGLEGLDFLNDDDGEETD